MMKRCAIKGITRDKEYDITKGTPKSEILYMSVNPNGEAEVLKVYFKPRPRLKKVIVDPRFLDPRHQRPPEPGQPFLALRNPQDRVEGARDLDARGSGHLVRRRCPSPERRRPRETAGRVQRRRQAVVWTSKNQYYITGYDLMQHFPDDTVRVARYESDRIYSLCYYDRDQQYYYMKRFTAEMSDKTQDFLDADADFVCVTDRAGAKLEITYKGAHASRPADLVDVDEFSGRQEPPGAKASA